MTREIQAEIRKAVEQGKADVTKALRAHAAEVLADTIAKMAVKA